MPVLRSYPSGLIFLFVGILYTFNSVGAAPPSKLSIQLYGGGPFDTGSVQYSGQNGFNHLFDSSSDWDTARADISSFEINTQFAVWGSDILLKQVFLYLNTYGIPLALEGLMLPSVGGIGSGVEGFNGPPGGMGSVVARIKMLGGNLSSLSMDEPLYFGHQSNQTNAPEWSINQVAQNVAVNVDAVRKIFPEIEIGDIEPIQYTNDLQNWISAYQDATGTPLAFLKADLNYVVPTWLSSLEDVSSQLTKYNIPLSVIFDGNSGDTSNISFTEHARQDFLQARTDPKVIFSQAVVQSWLPYPTELLPDYDAGTSTNLVIQISNTENSLNRISEPGSFFRFFILIIILYWCRYMRKTVSAQPGSSTDFPCRVILMA